MNEATTRRESEVWQACDDLWAKHSSFDKLTGDEIRQRLLEIGYKKGSPNEIYKYRKTWQLSRGISGKNNNNSDENQSNDPITRAVALVHEQLLSESEKKEKQLTERYENQLAKQKEEIDRITQENCNILLQNTQLNENISKLKVENNTLDKLLTQNQQEIVVLKERSNLQEKLTADYQKKIDLLLSDLKSSYDGKIQSLQKEHEKIIADKIIAINNLEKKLEKLGTQAMDESNELKVIINDANINKAKMQQKLEMLKKQVSEKDAVVAELQRKIAEQDKLQEKLSQKNNQLALKITEISTKEELLTQYNKENKQQKNKIDLFMKLFEQDMKIIKIKLENIARKKTDKADKKITKINTDKDLCNP